MPLTPGRRVMAAGAVATLFFARQIVSWSDPQNRFLYHWQRSDAFYLVAGLIIAAGLLWTLSLTVRRMTSPTARRACHLVFVVTLGQLLVACLIPGEAGRPGPAVIALVVGGITALAVLVAEGPALRAAVTVCLLLTPLPLILVAQMLLWRPWPACSEDLNTPSAALAHRRPVFIMIFDEWSLTRSVDAGEFLPSLRNVAALARTSWVFRNARSPGDETVTSMPRVLYQTPGRVVVGNGRAAWEPLNQGRQVTKQPSLFEIGRVHGYRTELLGFHLPYAGFEGAGADYCQTYAHAPKPRGLARLLYVFTSNLNYFPDPATQSIWRKVYAYDYSSNWFKIQEKIRQQALIEVGQASSNTLALFHFPLPHGPFIFEADGRYRGPFPHRRLEGSATDYFRSVQYLDLVLGQILDSLRTRDWFDSALVVVTSDHSWRGDPDPRLRSGASLRHVPLIVKWPGQHHQETVDWPLCLLSLGTLVEAAIGDRLPLQRAQVVIDSLGGSAAADACQSP